MCFGVHCLSLAVTVFHIPNPSNLSNSHFQMPVLQYVLYKLTRQTEANETAYPLPSWHSSFLLKPLFQLPFRALWLNITELILANLSQKGDYIRIMLGGSNQQKKMSPPAQGQYQVGSVFAKGGSRAAIPQVSVDSPEMLFLVYSAQNLNSQLNFLNVLPWLMHSPLNLERAWQPVSSIKTGFR